MVGGTWTDISGGTTPSRRTSTTAAARRGRGRHAEGGAEHHDHGSDEVPGCASAAYLGRHDDPKYVLCRGLGNLALAADALPRLR